MKQLLHFPGEIRDAYDKLGVISQFIKKLARGIIVEYLVELAVLFQNLFMFVNELVS